MRARDKGTQRAAYEVAAAGGALMAAAMGIGRFVYTPLLPHMQEALQRPPRILGWIASANVLGYLVGALLTSVLRPPETPRRVIAIGVVLSAITNALMGARSNVPMLAVFRFIGGINSALVLVYKTPKCRPSDTCRFCSAVSAQAWRFPLCLLPG